MATNSSRDARRRRIAERGSDRLSLITGRIQTLPSSSSPESLHSHTASCPPSISHLQHLPSDLSDQPTPGSPQIANKSSIAFLPKLDSVTESGELSNYDGGSREEPSMRKCETITVVSRASALELDGKVQSYPVSSTVQNSSISTSDMEHHFEPHGHYRKIFTPTRISSAIETSESTRICCSLAAAIIVVLSYLGFPILGSHIIKSIVFLRPLYLVLLTNISIVLARLLLEKQSGVARVEQEANSVPSMGGYGMVDQVGKALESGLVMQNIVGAVFMDFSVYAIVVICGLSLAQRLGW